MTNGSLLRPADTADAEDAASTPHITVLALDNKTDGLIMRGFVILRLEIIQSNHISNCSDRNS